MTAIAQRMRAAANMLDKLSSRYLEEPVCNMLGEQLRADADAIEAVEREMCSAGVVDALDKCHEWADRIRGEIK